MSFHEFPKWKYSLGNSVIVQDEAEEAALEGDWFDFPEQLEAHVMRQALAKEEDRRKAAASKKADEDLDKKIDELKEGLDDEPDLETLRVTATEMGIDWHPRTGAKKLAEQIKAAIEAKGE